MRNRTILATPLLMLLSGCSLFKSKPPAPPPHPFQLGATATLGITTGIPVIASTELPHGFVPDAAVPPMWLAEDLGIAIAGSLNGKGTVLGLSGPKLSQLTVIASDHGPAASAGFTQNVAASPDGMELALAVAEPANNRLNVMLIDSIGNGESHSVASFDGDYSVRSMNWIDRDTLAVLIYPSAPPTQIATNIGTVGVQSGGLYVIGITGLGSIAHLDRIPCRLGPLSFSPNRRFAASAGDSVAAPAVVDLENQTCAQIRATAPVKLLGWAPDSSAFLYAAANDRQNLSTFRYTLAAGRSMLVAVSSKSVAYASDGTIVAMGDAGLSWKRIAQAPAAPAKAEIALVNPQTAQITINSLGFQIPPAMFAHSTMAFTTASDSAAIDTFVPTNQGPVRELIDYSYAVRSAFVLASGPARGPLSMSWSPNGLALAIVDGNASRAMLTVMIPPR